MYKLLLLLIAASQVQGQTKLPFHDLMWRYNPYKMQRQIKDSLQPPEMDHVYIYTKKGWVEIDCDAYKVLQLEIQTLRLLNDSLTKRLKDMYEYYELSCPIIERFTAIKTINGYRLLFNRKQVLKAVIRYQKRYKNEQ